MDLQQIYQSVIDGEADETVAAVQSAIELGIEPSKILNEGLVSAMDEVGRRYEEGDFFVPEMLIAARAMQAGLRILRPYLVGSESRPAGKVAIGTIKGDLHDIGKNLVAMMLEGAGFEVLDLGVDVSPEAFIRAVREGAQIIGMAAMSCGCSGPPSRVMRKTA